MTSTFTNEKLQELYNTLNSYEGYNLRGIKQIHDAIYPLLYEVIVDDDAYTEAVFNWSEFQCVVDVVENNNREYTALNDEESMCYSLWWNTNYSIYQEQDLELEAIFPEAEDAYADSSILVNVHNHINNNGSGNNNPEYILI